MPDDYIAHQRADGLFEAVPRATIPAPDYDRLMSRLEGVIDHIVGIDQPNLTDDERFTLVGHLTGAVIVTVMDDQKEQP